MTNKVPNKVRIGKCWPRPMDAFSSAMVFPATLSSCWWAQTQVCSWMYRRIWSRCLPPWSFLNQSSELTSLLFWNAVIRKQSSLFSSMNTLQSNRTRGERESGKRSGSIQRGIIGVSSAGCLPKILNYLSTTWRNISPIRTMKERERERERKREREKRAPCSSAAGVPFQQTIHPLWAHFSLTVC